MKDSDGMLALLQDIKELLWGIALLSAGGFLCLIGIVIGADYPIATSMITGGDFCISCRGTLCLSRVQPPRGRGTSELNGGRYGICHP